MIFSKDKIEVLGSVRVVYTRAKEEGTESTLTPFTITASRRGVVLGGGELILDSLEDLDSFAKCLSEAWKESKRLTPKITFTAAGH